MSPNNRARKNRRQILKSVAAGASAATFAMGSAQTSAAEEASGNGKQATMHPKSRQLKQEYGRPQKAETLFGSKADGLVNKLHQIGVVPEETVDAYDFEKALDGTGKASISFVTVKESRDAPEITRVRLRRETDKYSISVVVEPTNNHAFALAIGEDVENRLAVSGEGLVDTSDSTDGSEISTQDTCSCSTTDCSYGYPCAGSNCCDTEKDNANQVYWPTYECEAYRDSNGDCQYEYTTYCTSSSLYDWSCACQGDCTDCSCW